MKRCVDEGTLQAYLDGELSHDEARETAAHLAACEACAASLAAAENETAFFAAAFAPDPSLAVPSDALRARLNAAVAQLESANEAGDARKSNGWSFNSFLASLSGFFTLTPMRAAAFAGVAAVFILFVSVFFIDRRGVEESREVAGGNGPSKTTKPAPAPSPTQEQQTGPSNANDDDDDDDNAGASRRRSSRGARGKGRTPFTPVPAPKPDQKMKQQFAPGEREYQSVIADLGKTIKAGEPALKPKVIADYERNLAVLDRAIEETRRVALQNPKDKDAVNFLRTAYQSKIELMKTVADSAQVATLDRD